MILNVLLYHSAVPIFLQECVIKGNRTPPAGEKQAPKCTAEAVDTRSVPRTSGLVLTAFSESDHVVSLLDPGVPSAAVRRGSPPMLNHDDDHLTNFSSDSFCIGTLFAAFPV